MSEERVERRLAAILAADVVGYSRLMGADEDGTLAALKAHRRELIDPADRRAPRPHRQDHRRRLAGRIRQRRRCGALRGRGPARHGRAQCRHAPSDSASTSASASISATSSSRATTSSATASTSPRGSKRLAEPGGICISGVVRDQVRDKLTSPFEDLGEQRSRTSPGRCASIGFGTARRAAEPPRRLAALPLPDKPSIAVLPFQPT